MADGERSPLLSEQHDGTNGFSPGGGSHGYPSKPQSTSVVLARTDTDTFKGFFFFFWSRKKKLRVLSLCLSWKMASTCKQTSAS